MKEEASDYLELETIKNLVKKYSQFINFPIYVWASKVMAWRRLNVKLNFDSAFQKVEFSNCRIFSNPRNPPSDGDC